MAERAKQQCGSGEEEEEEEEEGEEDETETADQTPVITLTIINVHPLHVAEARFNMRREMATAEAAGAKIVVKVLSFNKQIFHLVGERIMFKKNSSKHNRLFLQC